MTHTNPEHSEDITEETHRIKLALTTVFSSTNTNTTNTSHHDPLTASRDAANAYLTSFQPLPIAWMVCDALLHEDLSPVRNSPPRQLDDAKRYFAAQTLHSKCRYDIYQLPKESLASLRDSILQTIYGMESYAASKPLIMRLALAVSALSVHMDWNGAISDLIQHCSDAAATGGVHVVLSTLELLGRLAEELNVRTDTNVDVYVAEMRKNTALLFQFLDYCSEQAQSEQSSFSVKERELILRQVYACIDSNVYFLGIDQDVLNRSQIVTKLSQTMSRSSGQLHEVSVDALVTILRSMEVNIDYPANKEAILSMLSACVHLAASFHPTSLDEEVCRGYVRVFCEVGETLCPLLSMNYDLTKHADVRSGLETILDILLKCMDLEAEVAVVTLQFYFKFVNDILGYDFELIDVYSKHLDELVNKCVSLLRFPNDAGDLKEFLEDNDNFESNRFAILDLLEDLCRLLGSDYMVKRLCQNLQPDMISLEAILLSFHGNDKFISYDCPEVSNLFQIIESHVFGGSQVEFVANTANLFVASYARWLSANQNRIPIIFGNVVKSIESSVIQTSACRCLNRMADEIPELMDLKSIVQAYHTVELDPKNAVFLVECMAKLISVHKDANLINETLKYLLTENTGVFAIYCEKLTALVRYLPPNITVDVVKHSWGALASAAKRDTSRDTALAEKVCRFYKHSVRATKSLFEPFLNELMNLFVILFNEKFKSPFLYGASILVSEFSNAPQLSQMILALSSTFFAKLSTLEQYTQAPDVVEEFFYLMGRVVQYSSKVAFKSNEQFELTLNASRIGLKLLHRDAYKAVLVFIESLLASELASNGSLNNILPSYIKGIVELLISNLANGTTMNLDGGSGSVCGVLLKFNNLNPTETSSQLNACGAFVISDSLLRADRRDVCNAIRRFINESRGGGRR
eukprot:CAMPEP_0116055780 /NCGR_PEP_ID=MMETSP0322-20121206/3611_1 /TAXON_ID=163516 /ORGANISM="Leptocylindrus danicus var. apora, Strain B651" /LENGTH=920 /DNA_ID=CAMNT_0003539449 /DNA_START=60 /DNA_END=2822 /DNA_ORIENTATION=-